MILKVGPGRLAGVGVKAGVSLWRIGVDTPDYKADDASGLGAKTAGGRWNRKGTAMVYASSSRALSCLETLVHLGSNLPLNRYLVRIDVQMDLWEAAPTIIADDFVGWDAEPAGKVSLDIGKDWIESKSSLLLKVPSVVVPEESNVLVNPAHPDASKLTFTKVRKWIYDPRLI